MKNNRILFLIINGIIGLLCLIGVYYTIVSMQVELDETTNEAITDTAAVDTAVGFSFWFSIGSLILIAGFTVWAIIDNPKRFIPSFIGLAIFLVIFFISYGMAPIETSGPITKIEYATPFWIQWSGAGIIMTYIMSAIAVALILAGIVRGLMGFLQK